jgi:hypothetical protein
MTAPLKQRRVLGQDLYQAFLDDLNSGDLG